MVGLIPSFASCFPLGHYQMDMYDKSKGFIVHIWEKEENKKGLIGQSRQRKGKGKNRKGVTTHVKSTEKRWKLRHTEESMFITSSSPWVQLYHRCKNLRVLTDNKKGSVFTTLRSFRKEEDRLLFWFIPFWPLTDVVSYPSRGTENRWRYWLDRLGGT